MVKELVFSERFKKNFKKLNAADRKTAKEKLKLFIDDPFHPSLRTKKIQGTYEMWESSINMDVRMTWRWGEDENTIELSNIGGHDKTLKNP